MLSCSFPARLESLHPMQQGLGDYLRSEGCPESRIVSMELVCEELLVNSVTHGQASEISLGLEYQEGEFRLRWSDDGVEFDPNCPPTERSEVGGQGLPLIHRFFPALSYRREGGRNHLSLSSSAV